MYLNFLLLTLATFNILNIYQRPTLAPLMNSCLSILDLGRRVLRITYSSPAPQSFYIVHRSLGIMVGLFGWELRLTKRPDVPGLWQSLKTRQVQYAATMYQR